MGAESDAARTQASQALLNYGFRFFETRKIYHAGEIVASAKVWKGTSEEVKLSVAEDLYVAIPRGQFDAVEATAEVSESVQAPVDQGQTIGNVVLKLDGQVIASSPLVATHAIAQGSIFSRAIDEIMMRFE